jgi:ParB family chromosome partitioning protein
VAGERRWRAAQKAQLHEVPVIIRALDDLDALQLALVENLQRTDLSPIDEAAGYRRLLDEFEQTQEDVAKTMGKSRPHVANMLRLLDLPASVQEMVGHQLLSAGQARALLAFSDPTVMAHRGGAEKLTVRELEQLAKAAQPGSPRQTTGGRGKAAGTEGAGAKTADTKALEKRIEESLGLKASLVLRGIGEQTMLTLEIRDYDQLDAVIDRLTRR